MHFVIKEEVLKYQLSDLADWKAGKRQQWLQGTAHPHVANQPNYHFGEYFVIAHYARLGWQGHRFYALGNWEPNSQKLKDGRDALARTFEPCKLAEFRLAREACGRLDGKGEPDVFLVHPVHGALFLEVKKGRDRTSPEQLECLAQIRGILGANVGVVYLAKAGVPHTPRIYELEFNRNGDAKSTGRLTA